MSSNPNVLIRDHLGQGGGAIGRLDAGELDVGAGEEGRDPVAGTRPA